MDYGACLQNALNQQTPREGITREHLDRMITGFWSRHFHERYADAPHLSEMIRQERNEGMQDSDAPCYILSNRPAITPEEIEAAIRNMMTMARQPTAQERFLDIMVNHRTSPIVQQLISAHAETASQTPEYSLDAGVLPIPNQSNS